MTTPPGPVMLDTAIPMYAAGMPHPYRDACQWLMREIAAGRMQVVIDIRDQDLILPVVHMDLDTVDACVAKHFGIETAALKQHGRRAGPAKAVAVELACRLTGQSGRALGMHYGGISGAAVGNIRRKIREGIVDVLPVVERLVLQLRERSGRTRKV